MEEQAKRKRELLGEESFEWKEEEIFKKRKKMIRSPVRERGGKEEMIGSFKELAEEMREGIRGVRKEIKKMASEQK